MPGGPLSGLPESSRKKFATLSFMKERNSAQGGAGTRRVTSCSVIEPRHPSS